jgi:exonuclease SbcC
LILKELTLQNFRSYGENPTKIELERGLLLFEGDIGSGKSSILYAIEFALFGLGELEARSILRSSANFAKVELEFVVRDQEYKVTRTIERKKSAKTTSIQTRGWILEPSGNVSELSPTELRSRILQILSFKERQSARASSRIYRYAVFTPQELMKEVLSQKPQERLDTLRRAFGVEDYSFIASNTEVLLANLKNQIQIYSKLSENLSDKEKQLEAKNSELSAGESKLESLQFHLLTKQGALANARAASKELEKEVKRIEQLKTTLPSLESNLSRDRLQLSEVRSDLQRNLGFLKEIDSAERELFGLKDQYEKYLRLRDKLRELVKFEADMHDIEREIAKVQESLIRKETALIAELRSNQDQARKIRDRIETYNSQIIQANGSEEHARRLRERLESLPALQIRIEQLRAEIGNSLGIMTALKSQISEVQTKIKDLDGISEGSKCPLCGQILSTEHLRNVETEYRMTIKTHKEEESAIQQRLNELNSEMSILETQRREVQEGERQLEILEAKIAETHQFEKLAESSKKELLELEENTNRLEVLLANRDFEKEMAGPLSQLLARKELLLVSLEGQEGLRQEYQELEDSGIAESFQNAQAVVKNKPIVQDQVRRLETRSQELEKQIRVNASDFERKKKELEQSEPIILQFAKLGDEIKKLEEEHGNLNVEVQILSDQIRRERVEVSTLSKDVEELRRNASLASKSKGIALWLTENFLPAVRDIEKFVLATINEEFGQIFQRIFSILAVEEGGLNAKIDDSFTPLIEEGGYELDVQSLSGGERTAVALAYRLALNYMVKRANDALQTSLLILDEPTEGFSREQIYRFRNALEELGDDQVIIVSHERDLEPMADRVFRIEKLNDESTVSVVSP